MTLAWNYPRGGSEKLVLLALADWADDEGGNIYPSMAKIAAKATLSEAQARRVVHQLHEDGVLVPEPGSLSSGGAPGTTRRWRIALDKLGPCADATPRIDATPSAGVSPRVDATPSTNARDPLHGCARPLAPVQAEPSLTTITRHHKAVNSPAVVATFERFWTAWPRNNRKVAKAACQKKWIRRQLGAHVEKIVAHVEAMKRTGQWRDFCPAPLTYINQSRWEDELPDGDAVAQRRQVAL